MSACLASFTVAIQGTHRHKSKGPYQERVAHLVFNSEGGAYKSFTLN